MLMPAAQLATMPLGQVIGTAGMKFGGWKAGPLWDEPVHCQIADAPPESEDERDVLTMPDAAANTPSRAPLAETMPDWNDGIIIMSCAGMHMPENGP